MYIHTYIIYVPRLVTKWYINMGLDVDEVPQSEDAKLQIHTQMPQRADQIRRATMILTCPIGRPSQAAARSKAIDKHNHPL